MRHSYKLALTIFAAASFAGAGTADRGGGAASEWVFFKPDGKLGYKTMPKGDRIMDFSSAGYGGGGVEIPKVPVVKTISSGGTGDESAMIQAAIDEVAKMPLVKGIRGAVLLKAGTYKCATQLALHMSGVVLRGEGSGATGTVIELTGKPHLAVSLSGEGKAEPIGSAVAITDSYVPSGSATFTVANASGFKVGDSVLIYRPATEKWVHFMGMDHLVRTGKDEHWISGKVPTTRRIKAIDGNKVTLEVPLTDSFDSEYINPPGGTIVKCSTAARVSQVGLEEVRIVAPAQHVEITAALYRAVSLDGVDDAWVRGVEIVDTTTAVNVGEASSRVTVENVGITHSMTTVGAAKPADYSISGTQVLLNKCRASGGDAFYFVTGARVTGPVVLLNCVFHGGGWIQPHQRWATGLLVDNCDVPEGGIDLIDRGIMGSGHGWTIGWSVAWNCVAKSFQIEQPPGSMNWAIGCQGTQDKTLVESGSKAKLPEGIYESHGAKVGPSSLYLSQLAERAGPEAVKNIGY